MLVTLSLPLLSNRCAMKPAAEDGWPGLAGYVLHGEEPRPIG